MKTLIFWSCYCAIGVGCALVVGWRGRRHGVGATDAVLWIVLWPVYAPFRLQALASPLTGLDGGFSAALAEAAATPLAPLLPDPTAMMTLSRRLLLAQRRIAEIDGLLARPEFDAERAQARQRALEDKTGSPRAVASAAGRLQNIRRLQGMRARCEADLDEIRELLDQLRTHVELVRLAGAVDAAAADLLGELVGKIEGLDQVLALEIGGEEQTWQPH